jgi:hypothetical protein
MSPQFKFEHCFEKEGPCPTYDISFHCKDCGFDHPILVRIHVEDGPDCKQSIAKLFDGRSLPTHVAAIHGRMAFCLRTGRKFHLENDDEIFLVPPSDVKRDSVIR